MDFTLLGRSGLRASVMGLGAGGHSRLGQGAGHSVDHSVRIVHEALALGTNFFDTSEYYHTEEILGRALRGVPAERAIISTKKMPHDGGRLIRGAELIEGCERSLR